MKLQGAMELTAFRSAAIQKAMHTDSGTGTNLAHLQSTEAQAHSVVSKASWPAFGQRHSVRCPRYLPRTRCSYIHIGVVGPEYISMVSAEAMRPRIYIKAAFKTVYMRLALFFVGGSLCAGIVVAYNVSGDNAIAGKFAHHWQDPTLVGIVGGTLGGGGTAAASPYVIAMVTSLWC